MTRTKIQPTLERGRVYRTRDLGRWAQNPTRLARRLVEEDQLVPLAHGLFLCPRQSRFGPVPPAPEELMRAFLGEERFVLTGPAYWNALGLGSTAMFARPLVYNMKRTGEFKLGGQTYILRRISFPRKPLPEWYVVDLVQHHVEAGVTLDQVERKLTRAVLAGVFDMDALGRMATKYGSHQSRSLVDRAIDAAVEAAA